VVVVRGLAVVSAVESLKCQANWLGNPAAGRPQNHGPVQKSAEHRRLVHSKQPEGRERGISRGHSGQPWWHFQRLCRVGFQRALSQGRRHYHLNPPLALLLPALLLLLLLLLKVSTPSPGAARNCGACGGGDEKDVNSKGVKTERGASFTGATNRNTVSDTPPADSLSAFSLSSSSSSSSTSRTSRTGHKHERCDRGVHCVALPPLRAQLPSLPMTTSRGVPRGTLRVSHARGQSPNPKTCPATQIVASRPNAGSAAPPPREC